MLKLDKNANGLLSTLTSTTKQHRWILVLASGAAMATSLMAQTGQPERISSPPRPPEQANTKPESAKGKEEPAKSDRANEAPAGVEQVKSVGVDTKKAGDAPTAEAKSADEKPYSVTRFLLEYKSEHTDHPPVEYLLGVQVPLSGGPEGYKAPKPGDSTVLVRPMDIVEGPGVVFYKSAINAVCAEIIRALNDRGVIGVFVQLHPEDIEDQSGEDLRGGKRGDLRLIVWTGKITGVRTLASGDRLEKMVIANPEARVNPKDPVHRRIAEQSPVQAGDLIRQDKLDDYVFRLNRHPGRRVDVAIAPSGKMPEEVILDYLVAESKPWSVYAQVSNTGTKTTNEWRERVGFVHNQLTGHDDILRADFITSALDQSNALVGSYEFPLISDRLKTRFYGNISEFTASDVGRSFESFEGNQWGLGVELVGSLYQHREFFLDAVGGVRFQRVFVRNNAAGDQGQTNFVLPYAGLKADRSTDTSLLYGSGVFEFQSPSLAGTDAAQLQTLGRRDVDDNWTNLKYEAGVSFYLEPLFERGGGKKNPLGSTLAHEFAFSLRGQYVLNDDRVIANEEEIAGGMYSVRGYPESAVAGDNVAVMSAEYRFHLPQVLPVSNAGSVGSHEYTMFGPNFRYAPSGAYARTDWDLILKAFVDHAEVSINRAQSSEVSHSLTGAGMGLELQWKRNVSMRLDWGFALQRVEGDTVVDSGDNRLHFVMTILY